MSSQLPAVTQVSITTSSISDRMEAITNLKVRVHQVLHSFHSTFEAHGSLFFQTRAAKKTIIQRIGLQRILKSPASNNLPWHNLRNDQGVWVPFEIESQAIRVVAVNSVCDLAERDPLHPTIGRLHASQSLSLRPTRTLPSSASSILSSRKDLTMLPLPLYFSSPSAKNDKSRSFHRSSSLGFEH